jgi:hypothetical protein
VNSSPAYKTKTSLQTFVNESWTGAHKINYSYSGNELELAIPCSNFKIKGNKPVFSFHWSDNCQKLLDITEFFISGDSAPDRRFDYLFATE